MGRPRWCFGEDPVAFTCASRDCPYAVACCLAVGEARLLARHAARLAGEARAARARPGGAPVAPMAEGAPAARA